VFEICDVVCASVLQHLDASVFQLKAI
jgi:hypothetical protein